MRPITTSVALILLTTPALAQARVDAQPTRLDFRWPTPSSATVTETKRDGTRYRMTTVLQYPIHVKQSRGSIYLEHGEVKVVSTKFGTKIPDSVRRALSRHTLSQIRPNLEVAPTGTILGVTGFDAAIERVAKHESPRERAAVKGMLSRSKTRKHIEQRVKMAWQNWVERWNGLKVTEKPQTINTSEIFANGHAIAAKATVKFDTTKKDRILVDYVSVLDKDKAVALMRKMQPDVNVDEFRYEVRIRAVLARDTSLPHSVQVEQSGVIAANGKTPEKLSEGVAWTFQWKSAHAAPTKR